MELETISTGDELVRGRSPDTNAPWIARRAAEEGVARTRHTTVGDDLEALAAAFAEAGARADLVVVTGGLGPTEDDLTREAAARAAGVGLVFRPDLLEEIEARLAARGLPRIPGNRVQARLPEGAEPLPNPLGTAPGMRMAIGRAEFFFLSGVPGEMERMFDESVRPVLRERGGGAAARETIAAFGWPEARVDEALADLWPRRDVRLGLTAESGVIRIHLEAEGPGGRERVARRAEEVRRRLGKIALEAPDLPRSVALLLARRGAVLATAESCTGGLVGKLLTDVPGISAHYAGGVVAYADAVKRDLLGVRASTLSAHGAVSEPVAREMAEGVRARLGATLGVSVTGVAGPGGGSEEKPVGLVHFAVAAPDGTSATRRRFPGDRRVVRRLAANVALALVRRWLRNA